MKIAKFLHWIQKQLLHYPDIDFKTTKMIMDNFEKNLSKTEHKKFALHIGLIREFTSKQISLSTYVNKAKAKNLENKLNTLKGKPK